MPYVIQSQSLQPNSSANFTFSGQVHPNQCLVGVSSFQFTYGAIDHKVQQLGLSLSSTASYDASKNQSTVRVTPTGILSDASGNTIDSPNSYVTVSVLAWTGTSNDNLVLSNSYSFASNTQSSNITLPGSTLSLLNASLTGFNLNYGTDDYHVASVTAQVSPGQNLAQGFITGQSAMQDSSGHQAQNPMVSGNLLASNSSNPGLLIQPYTRQDSGQQNIPVGAPLTGAIALLTGFNVQFPDGDDHHVLTIGAGPNVCSVSSQDSRTVVTSGVQAWMSDQDGNIQDNAKSSASIIIVGILG